MKIRRALATAAATAAIAPAALLAAQVAYADDSQPTDTPSSASPAAPETQDPTAGENETTEPTGSDATDDSTTGDKDAIGAAKTDDPGTNAESDLTTGDKKGETATATPSDSASPTDTAKPSPSTSESDEPGYCAEDDPAYTSKLKVTLTGLPGKIAAGSGWHKFSMNVTNPSKSAVSQLDYFAAAAADKDGNDIFTTKQVVLQAYNPDDRTWEDVTDGAGNAVGYVGYTDKLAPDYEVNIPLRVNVKAGAPVGTGFTLGAGVYLDDEKNCVGDGQAAYKFQIVAPGTDTDGTRPQTGGKVPVPAEKPNHEKTGQVTGSLAETGSSSALPTIAMIGGVAMVVGAGAVFVVRRRKAAGSEAAA